MASEDAEEDESMAASPSRSGSAVVVHGSNHGFGSMGGDEGLTGHSRVWFGIICNLCL